MSRTVDPITLEVVCEGLIAIVREISSLKRLKFNVDPLVNSLNIFKTLLP